MNKLFLIKNPEVFQGEKYLNGNKNYFEGWYFKITSKKGVMTFIPGISINSNEKKAFIQVVTNNNSYYIDYDIRDFLFSYSPFYVKIGSNYFSRDSIKIDINDNGQKVRVYGKIEFSCSKNIEVRKISPNIMGPFAFVPGMECNHAILSMRNVVKGSMNINSKKILFDKGIGYIEKDWGCSFPKSYVWCQGNNFLNSDGSFVLSIAVIPFGLFNFRGVICSLIVDGIEYRFATYNGARVISYDVKDNMLYICLKRRDYCLEVVANCDGGFRLSAPVKGKMDKDIIESISSDIRVTLKKNEKVILDDTSINCGLEIVGNE